APSTVKKGCLFCHGKAEEAPFAIRNKYGVNSGYNWKIGTVIGGSAVGVPLANIYDVAFKRTLYALLALATIFGLIFLIINRMVSKNIIKPLLTISKQAQKISKGDMSKPILIESNDEIGDLGKSFELMRRSYISIIKRFRS
ncbi:MAG: HAMP domain-containing protein, partial [Arenicellales bacterium]